MTSQYSSFSYKSKPAKAFTMYDERFTFANKINNHNAKCSNNTPITAKQTRVKSTKTGIAKRLEKPKINVVVKCGCPHSLTTTYIEGGVFDPIDAIHAFSDYHAECEANAS